jgi:hypothetical protein
MLRALGNANGRKFLILGVDKANVEKLMAKKPIIVRGNEFGLDLSIDVVIMYGDTLEEVAKELRDNGIGPIPDPLPGPVEKPNA